MSLEKIPIIFNNKQLQELKQEAQIIEQTYWDLKEKARINDNNTLKDELKEVEEKRAKIKENIYMLEKSILEMQSSFVKISAEGNLSKRQIYAQKCLEQGDIEAAKQALKLEDIKEEAHKILDLHEARKEELQIKINELIQRIETLKLDTKNPDRFLQIEETFVEALKIEKQGGLYRKTILIYAQYLYNIKEFEKAIETGQKFISYLELEEIENKENLGNSYNIMGKSYSNLQDYKQAEQNLQKYIQIAEDLKDYEQIIEAYNNIIEYVYNKTNEYDKIEKYYEKLIEIYKNNIKSENTLAIIYKKLGKINGITKKYDKAEENLKKAEKITQELLQNKNETTVKSNLEDIYHILFIQYTNQKKFDLAQEYMLKTQKIAEELEIENPKKYAELKDTLQEDISKFYLKIFNNTFINSTARKIWKQQLINSIKDFKAQIDFVNAVINIYYELALEENKPKKVEKQIKQMLKFTQNLENIQYDTSEQRKKSQDICAKSYGRIGKLYEDIEKLEQAETYYKKAVEIRENMQDKNKYELYALYESYNNLVRYLRIKRRLQPSRKAIL